MGVEHSSSGFDAALVADSDLQRAVKDILFWAEVVADKGPITRPDELYLGDAIGMIDEAAADIRQLHRLVQIYRQAMLNARARRVVARAAGAS